MILSIGRLWILSLIVLLSVGLAGCAGSPAGALVDAANRPGGLWAVVPCRHEPDIGDAVRSAVLVRKPKTCQAQWTHPTATQDQLVEDMTACSKAAFWVLSPSAAQDQRLACMESKGYRRNSQQGEAGAPVAEPSPVSQSAMSGVETQLQRLDNLKARGDISEDEYATRRQRVLERLNNLKARGDISEEEYTTLRKLVLDAGVPTASEPIKTAVTGPGVEPTIASWLTGTWVATAPSPGGSHMQDTFELTVKTDGTFEEIVNSARGGRIYVSGRWQISGETAILEGVYQGGPSFINATRKTVTLKRNGNSLEGIRLTHYNSQTHPITFTRAK